MQCLLGSRLVGKVDKAGKFLQNARTACCSFIRFEFSADVPCLLGPKLSVSRVVQFIDVEEITSFLVVQYT